MAKSKTLLDLKRKLANLHAYPKQEPYEECIEVNASIGVETLSKEKLIDIIATKNYWFTGYEDYVDINYSTIETVEERDIRICREQKEYNAWKEQVHNLNVQIDAEQKLLAQQKIERKEKFKNPEYIEFLRMQAKMKE